MEICFLGTAPGLPLPDRFGQTIVVATRDTAGEPAHHLLDVGDGASSLLVRHGYDHLAIESIVITHMHADHHGGLAQVLKTSMHLGRSKELVILAPAEGIPALRAYLDASYLYSDWLGYPIRWESLSAIAEHDGFTLHSGLRYQVFHNDHLASARHRFKANGVVDHGRSFESFSLSIEHGGRRIVYSGNLLGASGADEMASFAEPADLLICELAHVRPENLGRFLANRLIRQTVLAHISPTWQGVADQTILDLVQGGAVGAPILGPVLLARDGEVCTVLHETHARQAIVTNS